MSDTKFTPGPWRFSSAHNDISTTANIKNDVICDVEGSIYKSLVKPENAQLIAAAPELFTTLRAIVDTEDDGLFEMLGDEFCGQIDRVLAKARGEA